MNHQIDTCCNLPIVLGRFHQELFVLLLLSSTDKALARRQSSCCCRCGKRVREGIDSGGHVCTAEAGRREEKTRRRASDEDRGEWRQLEERLHHDDGRNHPSSHSTSAALCVQGFAASACKQETRKPCGFSISSHILTNREQQSDRIYYTLPQQTVHIHRSKTIFLSHMAIF